MANRRFALYIQSSESLRSQNQRHRPAFHSRRLLDSRQLGGPFHNSVEVSFRELRVRELTASEDDRHLDLVAILEKPLNVPQLELEVMLVGVGLQSDALHFADVLLLPGLSIALSLLIFVLAVIHDLAHGRLSSRRNLDQIESLFPRHAKGISKVHDACLRSGIINQPALT